MLNASKSKSSVSKYWLFDRYVGGGEGGRGESTEIKCVLISEVLMALVI